MAERTQKPIDRLMMAMDRCALTRGEANWTNGYRAARHHFRNMPSDDEQERLHEKECNQWEANSAAEKAFRRLALRVLRPRSPERP